MKKLILILTILVSLLSCKAQVPAIGGWMPIQTQTEAYEPINYGYLYNWYAVDITTTGTNIANTGWHVPTKTELDNLRIYLDPSGTTSSNIAGTKLKEAGSIYWTINNDGTNEAAFNARGSGYRNSTNGTFSSINLIFYLWTSTKPFSGFAYVGQLNTDQTRFYVTTYSAKTGNCVRLVCDTPATGLADGIEGTYIGNDLKVYRTVVINEEWWLADNLTETKYRNGTSIPEVTDATTWAGLTTGARCVYNNDENNR